MIGSWKFNYELSLSVMLAVDILEVWSDYRAGHDKLRHWTPLYSIPKRDNYVSIFYNEI